MRAACFASLLACACAQVRVLAPEWLASHFSKGRIEGATATFGAPFYGDEVVGRLVWGDSQKGDHHCREDDYEVPPPDELRSSSGRREVRLINIIMVRRGKCSFTTKVRVARKKGAHAVIIVDQEDSKFTSSDLHQVIVADDGYGDKIHIPSILVSKEDGARLIHAAKHGHVVIELSWDVPMHHVVDMDLWMSSGSRASMKFLRDFAVRRKKLNRVLKFEPHYAVFSIPTSDPGVYNQLCSDNSGQFCAEDPDGAGPVTGSDVLDEDVRQLCIHEVTKVSRTSLEDINAGESKVEYADQYWRYVGRLMDACPLDGRSPERRFGTTCSERLMGELGLDVGRVRECASSTGDAKLRYQRENVAWSPRALRINGWRYSGMLDPDLVTRAVCAGFIHRPQECEALTKPRDPFAASYEKSLVAGTAASGSTLVVVTVALFGSVFGSMLLYKRAYTVRLQREVREEVMLEVEAQMRSYSQLPDLS